MGLMPLFLAVALTTTVRLAPGEAPPCVPRLQLAQPDLCPGLGPGAYAIDVARARVPDPMPALPLAPAPAYEKVVDYTYARVVTPEAPLFATPADGVAGVVKRSIGTGFIYVSPVRLVEEGGQPFYEIRTGEFIRAADVAEVKPSTFQGLLFDGPPQYTVGWVVANVTASARPGIPAPDDGPFFARKTVVQIFATVRVGKWDWYLVGPNQWVEQRAVSRLNLNPPPEGVTGRWVQVDLFEQTMAAYEDDRLVYATLVSSGLPEWSTRPGLFRIYTHLWADRMRGSYRPDGSDYYSLEMVPWVMYYDGARALHGEYWHDRLGFKRSHGCVNLAPLDAHWLYDWADKGVPVWVYDPSGETPVDVDGGGAP
jgi:hypothetical protein